MSKPLPIACSLSADELADRTGWIAALNRGFLRAHHFEHGTLRLLYDAAAFEDVRTLVEKEQECCAFLHFAIEQSGNGVELRIDVSNSDGTDVAPLFAPFLSGARKAAKASR